MGLDQYLNGERFHMKPFPRDKNTPVMEQYQLGYWRKHPNLHGHIVQTYAEGRDDCQPIPLSPESLKQIITVIENDALPRGVEGFFFGESYVPGDEAEEVLVLENGTLGPKTALVGGYEWQKADDLKIFREALEWLQIQEPDVFRSVHYLASW